MSDLDDKKINIDTEDLKNQTKETVQQFKDTIKDVNFKEDAKETTGFIKEMITNPYEAVRSVAKEERNAFKNSIIIMILYIAANVIYEIISIMKYGKFSGFGNNVKGFVVSFIDPVRYMLVPTIIVFAGLILTKRNKKSLTTIISTLVVAYVPSVIAEVVLLVERLAPAIDLISSPIRTGLGVVTTILTYFGMKEIFEEEEHANFIKIFLLIEVVEALANVILSSILH